MAANAAFTRETLTLASQGQTTRVGPWTVQLVDVVPTAGRNFSAYEAELIASRGAGPITLKPQTRFFTSPPAETSEAAIATFWNGQLYTVVGKQDPSGGWQLRLWWKPFVTLIWLGGGLVGLGGLLAMFGRLGRILPRRREREWRRAYS
jgi:cytochrome c-type biogenesis protein CcmF